MHCGSNYPAKKSKSDIDIELKDYMEDEEYLNILYRNLKNSIKTSTTIYLCSWCRYSLRR